MFFYSIIWKYKNIEPNSNVINIQYIEYIPSIKLIWKFDIVKLHLLLTNIIVLINGIDIISILIIPPDVVFKPVVPSIEILEYILDQNNVINSIISDTKKNINPYFIQSVVLLD